MVLMRVFHHQALQGFVVGPNVRKCLVDGVGCLSDLTFCVRERFCLEPLQHEEIFALQLGGSLLVMEPFQALLEGVAWPLQLGL